MKCCYCRQQKDEGQEIRLFSDVFFLCSRCIKVFIKLFKQQIERL